MAETVEIRLSPRAEFVGAVRQVLSALGRLAEMSADSVEDLKLAISEAVTNAVTREAAEGSDEEIRIVVSSDEAGVTVEVTDAGGEFDDGSPAEDQASISSEEFSFETGLSLPIVRGLTEHLEMRPAGSRGMTVRFTIKADRTSE
jgi:serine/threonine-protein kinase RsbW